MIKWYVSKNGTKRYYRPIDTLRFKIVMTAILNDLPMPYQHPTKLVVSKSKCSQRGYIEIVDVV